MKGMKLVDAQELVARIEAGTAPTIIDVKSRWEFERGHVPGARHFSFWNIASHADEIAVPKAAGDRGLLWYRSPGEVGVDVASAMWLWTRQRLLDGHWAAWVHDGRPQLRSSDSSSQL